MHIFACKMQRLSKREAAARRLISIFSTDRWSAQTSVEIQPLVNEGFVQQKCHIIVQTRLFDEEGSWQKHGAPVLPFYPPPYQLYLIQPCLTSIPAVQYRLICHVSSANFNALPSHMLWKKDSATPMLWLPSNPQLNKHRGQLQVGRHWDVCLSRQSAALPSLQLTPSLSDGKSSQLLQVTVISRNRAAVVSREVSKCKSCARSDVEREEKCSTLEDVLSKGPNQIGWKRWLWMINQCNN